MCKTQVCVHGVHYARGCCLGIVDDGWTGGVIENNRAHSQSMHMHENPPPETLQHTHTHTKMHACEQ